MPRWENTASSVVERARRLSLASTQPGVRGPSPWGRWPQSFIQELNRLLFSGSKERNKPHHCPHNRKYQSEFPRTNPIPIIAYIRLRQVCSTLLLQ